jgi:hypothetical protein
MTDEQLMEALAEAEQLDRIEHEFAEFAAKKNAEWTAQWPNHCKYCGGWGGFWFDQSHPYGAALAIEYQFDLCDALAPEVCHRCGEAGIDPDDRGTGQCLRCGWYLNDGVPVM